MTFATLVSASWRAESCGDLADCRAFASGLPCRFAARDDNRGWGGH